MEENEVIVENEAQTVIIDAEQYETIVQKVNDLETAINTVNGSVVRAGTFLAFLCVFAAYGIFCRIRKKGVGR